MSQFTDSYCYTPLEHQNNVEERNEQAQRVKPIYQEAEAVYIYLGIIGRGI